MSGKPTREATSSQLTSCLLPDDSSPYNVTVTHASELSGSERQDIWLMFEANMRDLYTRSSFGWDPTEKKKELFHDHSRFLTVFGDGGLMAFSMFRFDVEDSEEVLYCYELQVSSTSRRTGLGATIMQHLSHLASSYQMERVMLTVQKENTAALKFYEKMGWVVSSYKKPELTGG